MQQPAIELPTLSTERLQLRPLGVEDKEAILRLRSNEEVIKYIDRPLVKNEEEAVEFIQFINRGIQKGDWYYWGIVREEENSPIGIICLWNFSEDGQSAEVGYEIHPEHQRQGLMSEAMDQVVGFGFGKIGLQKLEAYTNEYNEASTKLLEKHGFEFEKDAYMKKGARFQIFTLDRT